MALVDRLKATGDLSCDPTFFEVTTAIAFAIFRQMAVTAAVIEVGLGGRFDATNVITPVVAAITSIDFDHQRHLGRTLPQIAFEKAGIIKARTPVVVGDMAAEAHAVIAETARIHEAPLIDAVVADVGTPVGLALNGDHQRKNAAVAVATLRAASSERFAGGPVRGIPAGSLTREHLIAALSDVEWPARLEWLRVPGGGDILIDAAHNPAGARALAVYVTTTVEPLPMVIGVMRDKDVEAIIRELSPAVSRFVATTVASPRALPARELAARIARVAPLTPCEWRDDVESAVRLASDSASRIVAAGSIFLVGPLRAGLVARGAVPVRYPSKAGPFYLS
jgi:dihydrofolate synthase/folylpolyglutamate synthase